MSVARILTYVSAGLLVFALANVPRAKADTWNQKTEFTFSGPVEIPGQVLPAGTYVFKLADSNSDRNIVEVYNKDENHLYGMFLAIPDYHLRAASKPIITFEERAQGAPEAVKAWFYPGENYGHDFVYPKTRAMELAAANHQAVPSMPNEMTANTTQTTASAKQSQVTALKSAPLKAQKPNREEAEISEVFTPPPATTTTHTAPPATTTAKTTPPAELPQTASPLGWIGLIGLLSLVAAGSFKFTAARMK